MRRAPLKGRISALRLLASGLLILGGLAGLFSGAIAQQEEMQHVETAPSVPVTVQMMPEDTGEAAAEETAADPPPALNPNSDRAVLLELKGPIGPALAHYIVGGIEDAQSDAALIVLEMDTPGGLDTSMREIIQAILASDVPVATYVAPSGARAASAGAFVLYASHIAAMAPGTAVGAATPIQMGSENPLPIPSPNPTSAEPDQSGGDQTQMPMAAPTSATSPRTPLDAKAMNDAVSLARGLAEMRGRDPAFAEAMIRDAASVNSNEALERGIIDFIARNMDDLLAQADGRIVAMADGDGTVHAAGLQVDRVPMNWMQQFIAMITDPNIAFILMNLGFLGLLVELYNPGAILPGVVGTICLILALYALSVLPFSATGLALVVVGLLMMGAEIFIVSGGVLAVGGFIAFAIGAFFLFDSPLPAFQLDWRVLVGTLAIFAILLFLVIAYALNALRRKVTSGPEELIGMRGKVVEWHGTEGIVFLDGENWQSRSQGALEPGQPVIATAREGNFLVVQGA